MEIVFSDEKLLLVHPFGAINTIAFMLPIKKRGRRRIGSGIRLLVMKPGKDTHRRTMGEYVTGISVIMDRTGHRTYRTDIPK